jgi:hypothetical protein
MHLLPYLVITFHPTYPIGPRLYKVKPHINSVGVHPQLSHNKLPMNRTLVAVGSLWPNEWAQGIFILQVFLYKCFFFPLRNSRIFLVYVEGVRCSRKVPLLSNKIIGVRFKSKMLLVLNARVRTLNRVVMRIWVPQCNPARCHTTSLP